MVRLHQHDHVVSTNGLLFARVGTLPHVNRKDPQRKGLSLSLSLSLLIGYSIIKMKDLSLR